MSLTLGLAVAASVGLREDAGSWILFGLMVAGGPALLHICDGYPMHGLLYPRRHLRRIVLSWSVPFCAAAAIVLNSSSPAIGLFALLGWYLLVLFASIAFRFAYGGLCRVWNRKGQLSRRAALVGGGAAAEELIAGLRGDLREDIAIVGIFDDRDDARSPPSVAGCMKLGTVETLLDLARRVRIDLLLVTLPVAAERRLLELLRKLWVLPVDIRLSAHTQQLRYRPRSYSNIGPVPFLDLSDKPITGWNAVVKAIEDRVLATLAIVLLAPVMALVWLAIRLESQGPAIFRQKRYGFNNELIEVYKFRSMYADRGDPEARRLTTRDDPRVTRVGRFIRKTSLDELPQLFNVLKGELSMVGPRPQAPMAGVNNTVYADIVEEYFARTKVKPGITGWAQVNGWRGNTDTPEKIQRRVEFDLHYIENWSLLFDLYILARTPLSLLDTENAY
ncbi:MAG TPA: undecaprenyl-phosphate glucose phosphotransferase [Aestuariivirgaceae bacterium]|nr:undecaprenyl-phosphate glucose phosphotransferase [Aestuariivirgaceae bacterium]